MKKLFFLHLGGNKPGPVSVKIFDTNNVYLGEDTYTYYEPEPTKKRKKQCLPSRKRKHEEIKEVIRKTIQDSLKQLKRESEEERNETDPQQGESNLSYCLVFFWLTHLFTENGFKLLVQ